MTDANNDVRSRIVRAAADLLAEGGRDAVSTRAVSAAAGVQAPTIYRQFGDMKGLLDAVALETLESYVSQKRMLETSDDPIADLRRGWDQHLAFGLANPAAYTLIFGDPTILADSAAKREAESILLGLITRAAEKGVLRVGVPQAARMISATGRGIVMSLIATKPEERDLGMAAATREAMITAITVVQPTKGIAHKASDTNRVATRAVALRAVLAEAPGVLSGAEQHLLGEWLDRLSALPDSNPH